MNNRPTPETDAAASPHIGFYSCATVTANFARILERERDEARAGRQAYKQLAVKHAQERDEARKERDQLKQLLAADSERVDAYLGVCIERDEAREELNKILKNE